MNQHFLSMLYCHNIGFSHNQPRCHSERREESNPGVFWQSL